MLSNTTGSDNIAIGQDALRSQTTAGKGVAIGFQALYNSTVDESGVAIGYQALFNITSGNANIGIGVTPLFSETSGRFSIAIGDHALFTQNGGNFNTAIGYVTGRDITTGQANTAVGHATARGITTGSNNTILGAQVGLTVANGGHSASPLPSNLTGAIILADGLGAVWWDYNFTTASYWTAAANVSVPGFAVGAATLLDGELVRLKQGTNDNIVVGGLGANSGMYVSVVNDANNAYEPFQINASSTTIQQGQVNVNVGTNSSSSVTGALIVAGGVGIAKALFVGSNINITGSGVLGIPQATWADNQTCSAGQISVDASFIYVCTATNTVKRVAISTF